MAPHESTTSIRVRSDYAASLKLIAEMRGTTVKLLIEKALYSYFKNNDNFTMSSKAKVAAK